jgi:hypothetical protein
MPAPQWTPPGHLDWHVVIVAATPAALALVAGGFVSVAGGGRAARALGWIAMAAALALLAAFLRPQGVAAAYTTALVHGWLRVGPWQVVGALLAGLWSAWAWRPDEERRGLGWGWRTMLSILMPLLLTPFVALGCERDLRATSATAARLRPPRLAVVLILGALACWLVPALGDGSPWARLPMAAASLTAASCAPGPWRVPLILAGLAALMPLHQG